MSVVDVPRGSLLRFWGWAGAAVLLAGLVPVTAVLGFAAADSTAVHVAVACLLPLLVGMTFRAASTAIAAARTSAS